MQKYDNIYAIFTQERVIFCIFLFMFNNVHNWFLITASFEMAEGIFSLAGISNNKWRCKFQMSGVILF